MGKSVMALGNELREVFAQVIEAALTADYDVLRVPLSADSTSDGFQLAIPTTDSEQNEKTVLIHISVPKGNRDGVPYDPYEENGETVNPDPIEEDCSEYSVAGSITDNRDGTVTVKMGKPTDAELLNIIMGGN